MKLTVAIPTYNRAKRLEKALIDLLIEVNSSINKKDVEVYISNNGSNDETEEIIQRNKKIYSESGVGLTYNFFEKNQGFDSNVLACYSGSLGQYIWFLSDDDNINRGAIDIIFSDIKNYDSSVIYYNFDQYPHNLSSPYIKDYQYFESITVDNLVAVQKIIHWPKLSALVIKNCDVALQTPNQNSGFAHVTLALLCSFTKGNVLHSPKFLAYPDEDYKDHIDYVPYIANNLDLGLRWVLISTNKMDLYKMLALPYSDPLISSLNVLGAYYRGKYKITRHLKKELWASVRGGVISGWYQRLVLRESLIELIKFPLSIVYGLVRKILLNIFFSKSC